LYNDLKRGDTDWNLKMMYNTLPEKKRAADCVRCGACLTHCPQRVNIPKELATVAETFN
jgi:hypothetical protein